MPEKPADAIKASADRLRAQRAVAAGIAAAVAEKVATERISGVSRVEPDRSAP